jgi:hypothetical protein
MLLLAADAPVGRLTNISAHVGRLTNRKYLL